MNIEFVVLDGEAGHALRQRQAAIMRRVLQWISDHPDEIGPDANGGHELPQP